MDVLSPETQPFLFGHDAEEKTLAELWARGTLAGSWLFCGPKGVGKATLAYRLARFVLAQSSQEKGLFGEEPAPLSMDMPVSHPVFRAVSLRAHPGLKVIERVLKDDELKSRQALIESGKALDPEAEKERKRFDEIRVSDIREAGDFLRRTSAAGGWRVMIIDSADEMNTNAANALLKSLEEPPSRTIIVLVSHSPGRLLPTIRSRCRRLTLKPLKKDVLAEFLMQNRPDRTEDEINALSLLADGSPGLALTLADGGGLELFRGILELFRRFPDFSIPALYDFAEKTLKDKEKMRLAQSLLLQWLVRTGISLSAGDAAEHILPEEGEIIRRIGEVLAPVDLMEISEEIRGIFQDIDLDQKQTFVNACLKIQKEGEK
ncbi:MAG: DNA polymerase III subunit delta' [Alphaproteobacteria bacterium]|jgi:DNA polymerase-3 subunit delta'